MKATLLLLEALTALVFIVISLPLIYGKIPPNRWYGVRTKKTLSDEELWYRANAVFGRDFLVASIVMLVWCAVFYVYRDSISLSTFMAWVPPVLMVPTFVALIKIIIYLRKQ